MLPVVVRRASTLLLLALAFSSAQAQDSAAPYALRHGDKLLVSVWREEGLSREVRVLPDGSISFPLVGRLMVAGLTTTQVEQKITDGLKKYIPEANVTAAVTATEGNTVFVLGKVTKAGQIPLMAPNVTVLQVLSQVGGLDRFANGDAILILRRAPSGGMQPLKVRYNELMKGEALDTNVVLQPGDTILVP